MSGGSGTESRRLVRCALRSSPHRYVSEGCRRRQGIVVDPSGELFGAGNPQVTVQAHWKMRKRSGIPAHTLVDDPTVHGPRNATWSPVDRVEVEVQGSVEAEIDVAGRAPIAKAHRRP